jgi:hypothetical protein
LGNYMGLFSRKPKANPKIVVDGVEFVFKGEVWEFAYRGTEFIGRGHEFTLPARADLDWMVESVARLKAEMRTRLEKGLSEWGDSKLDDGESYWLDVTEFSKDRSYAVSWCGGESWGDLGVDFTITDGVITDESWGD